MALFPGPGECFTFVVYGVEHAPSTGQAHLQCYVELDARKRGRTIKAWLGIPHAHFEILTDLHKDRSQKRKKGFPQARWDSFCYCTKGDGCKANPNGPNADVWIGAEAGRRPPRPKVKAEFSDRAKGWISLNRVGKYEEIDAGARLQYGSALQLDLGVFKSARDFEDLPVKKNLWIAGISQIGKNHFIRNHFPRSEVYRFPDPSDKWWCGYNDEAVVWIDEMDDEVHIAAHRLKVYADQYAFFAQPKRSMWRVRPAHIIVTSQYKIDEVYKSARAQEAIFNRFAVCDLFERCVGTSRFCACVRCGAREEIWARVAAMIATYVDKWELPKDDAGCYLPVRARVISIEGAAASTAVSCDDTFAAATGIAALQVEGVQSQMSMNSAAVAARPGPAAVSSAATTVTVE